MLLLSSTVLKLGHVLVDIAGPGKLCMYCDAVATGLSLLHLLVGCIGAWVRTTTQTEAVWCKEGWLGLHTETVGLITVSFVGQCGVFEHVTCVACDLCTYV